jgi:hypothetical protein
MKPASPWLTFRYHFRGCKDALRDVLSDAWHNFVKRNIVDGETTDTIHAFAMPCCRHTVKSGTCEWRVVGGSSQAERAEAYLSRIEKGMRPLTDGRAHNG